MRIRFAAVVFFTAVVVIPAHAQNVESLRLQVDNDWFDFWLRSVNRPDENYTAGHAFHAIFDTAPQWALLGRRDCSSARSQTAPLGACIESFIAVIQKMFTPTNDSFTPKVGERPYAGVLFAELGRRRVTPRGATSLAAVVGTTGNLSGNAFEQRLFHRLAELRTPEGWAHQVATEPVVGATYATQYLLTPPRVGRRTAATISATASAVATTVQENASAGLEMHFGHNAPHPWMPTNIADRRRLRAYFILGAKETWVARDVLLEGNSAETRGLVVKEPFLFESVWGVAVGGRGYFLEYRATSQSRDYRTAPSWHRWGSISLIAGTP